MRLRYSPKAAGELEAIHKYLAERSPRGAANVMAAIFAAAEFIRRNPEAAPSVRNIAGMRGLIVRRYRFKIFYRVLAAENIIDIVHVRHTSRRPWPGDAD